MIWAIISDGVVVNRTEGDDAPASLNAGEWAAPDAENVSQIGGTWDGQGFVAVPEPDPPQPTAADIDLERDRRIVGGFEFQGVRYQTRDDDRENIAGAAQLAFMAVVAGADLGDFRWADAGEEFAWIAEDNSRVPMDAFTVVEFGKTAATHKRAQIFAASDLKQLDPIPADYSDDAHWL